MIALDTNVLVRYLVEDDPVQTEQAARLIEGAIEREEKLFVSQIVFCELVWVLSFAYNFSRAEIAPVLNQLRRGAQLVAEGPDEIRRATDAYSERKGDFADYLIAETALAHGCSSVATFDRALLEDGRFRSPA